MLKLLVIATLVATVLAYFSSEPGKVFLLKAQAIFLLCLVRALFWLDDKICIFAAHICASIKERAKF